MKESNLNLFEDEYVKQFEHDEKIIPCPFCGRDAIYLIHKGYRKDEIPGCQENAMKGLFYVGCPEPISKTHVCEIVPSASWFVNLEIAIENWNLRYAT